MGMAKSYGNGGFFRHGFSNEQIEMARDAEAYAKKVRKPMSP